MIGKLLRKLIIRPNRTVRVVSKANRRKNNSLSINNWGTDKLDLPARPAILPSIGRFWLTTLSIVDRNMLRLVDRLFVLRGR
jgi:hypothetical protein